VRQDGIKDCGVACLLMIIRTYKGGCSKEYLRNLTHTTKDGTTAYDLMKAGEKFHFTTFGLKGKIEDLEEAYFPVIAHVIKDEVYQHFVVVYKFDKTKHTLIVADPAIGIRKVSQEEFSKISTNQFIIFIQNGSILNLQLSKHPLFTILKDFGKQNLRSFGIILFFSLLYTIFSIVSTFCLQCFVSSLQFVDPTQSFSGLFVIFILCYFLQGLFQYLRFLFLIRLTQKFDSSLFQNIYHHLFLLPDSYYQNRTTGELLARITDLTDLKNTIQKFLLDVLIDSVLAVISLVILFLINPVLTFVLLFFVGLEIFIFCIFKRKLRRMISIFKESYAKFHSYLVDTIEAVSSIRHVKREGYIEAKFSMKHQEQAKESVQYQKCWNLQMFLKNTVHNSAHVLLITIGSYFIYKGTLSISLLTSYLFLSSFFLNPLESIYEFLLDYQDSKEAFERIEEFYQVEEESSDCSYLSPSIQSLEARNINCFYRRNERVLVDFSISFLKSEKVLIYGKSGCGKSTLMKILAGYMDSYQGDVFANGQVVSKADRELLRRSVTYVAQNEVLLNMTLRENILLGREVSEEKFLEICHLLLIDEFASKNVLTYDMPIEENGVNLSGGERQRVILARSIFKESDVYIFDESLCNMDVDLERKVLKNLFQYLQGKTIIVVSHRFYNQDLYDRRIQMEKGGCYAENYE